MSCAKTLLAASNIFVVAPFYYFAKKIEHKSNYSLHNYCLIAPVWLGFWNIFCSIVANYFGLSVTMRFLLQPIFTTLLSITIVKTWDYYNFTKEEWNDYYLLLFTLHFITWNVTVRHIESIL